MQTRIFTSEGDQGIRPGISQWQRDRAGRVQPMAERMGRHWLWDVAGGCLAMLVIVVVTVSL